MGLFRRGLPRAAIGGAFVGFAYGLLVMPTGLLAGETAIFFAGAGWCLLALSLLFGHAYAYYTYVAWALLWMGWKGTLAFQGKAGDPIGAALDVLIPLVSLALLSASGYLEIVRPKSAREE